MLTQESCKSSSTYKLGKFNILKLSELGNRYIDMDVAAQKDERSGMYSEVNDSDDYVNQPAGINT